jgi:hypothetical protein
MTQIKKKYNWHITTSPPKPSPPRIPNKTNTKSINLAEYDSVKLSEINIPQEYLDQGYTVNDLSFSVTGAYEDYRRVKYRRTKF